MTVDNRKLTGTTPAESGRIQETQTQNRHQETRIATPATDKTGDHVEFSSTLGALSRVMAAHGSERANRVAALTAQYQSGNFHPDSAATARGMVSEAFLADGK